MNAGTEGTIVERLTAQRTLLVDVVRQIDTAITAFGGAPTNGNGATATNGERHGKGGWQKYASPAKLARWKRKMASRKVRGGRPSQTSTEFTPSQL